MEYSTGQSLQDVMDDLHPERLPLQRTLDILFQVTDAIAAAHEAQVVHRDLKPGNILLTRDGAQHDRVKILDFGMAKILGDSEEYQLTRKGEIFGTPAFLSPEQARGDTIDHRTDIYSLGVMMFELLSGRLPFEYANVTRMLIAHQEEAPPRPSSFLELDQQQIPAPLEDLVLCCLAKAPADRPQSVAEIHRVITQQREELRKIGLRPTIRFADLKSLDLEALGFAPGPDLTLSPTPGAETQTPWDDDTSTCTDALTRPPARPDVLVKPEPLPGSDDERRSWYWLQACKKAKTLAAILQREQPHHAALSSALLHLAAAEDLVLSLETEVALLQDRHDELDRTCREKESALRYAVVDLSIARGRLLENPQTAPSTLEDLDYQIGQLERRINDIYREKVGKLNHLDDQQAECLRRLGELQHRLADEEVSLLRLVRSLRPSCRSPQAEKLYESIDSHLQLAR
jgi:hypothetical protein